MTFSKLCIQVSFWGASTETFIVEFQNFSLQHKNRRFWEQNYVWPKSKRRWILLNKNISFNKTKQNRKRKIPHTVSERQTLCFSSFKNRKIKVKLWWVGARERKQRAVFEPFATFMFYLNAECIEQTFTIHIFLHIKKHYFMYTFLLVFKIVCSVSLSGSPFWKFQSHKWHISLANVSSQFQFGIRIEMKLGWEWEWEWKWNENENDNKNENEIRIDGKAPHFLFTEAN